MTSTTTPVQTFSTSNFPLDAGVKLPELKLAYQTFGNVGSSKTILVSTCFGEGINESNPLIGEGKALDPQEYFVIRIALLGGGDSSSPSNTSAPYDGENFPRVSYSDMVRSHVLLLESLGIKKLEAVVGFSMGGQLAYHWGALHPEMVERIVCLATSAKTSVHNIAFLEGPIAALVASEDYSVGGKGTKGFGRAYCAWAYSHDWFEQSKWEESGFTSLEDFMTKCWHNDSASGYDLLSLARTWQASNIATAKLIATSEAPYSNLKLALNSMKPKALVLPVRTDQYFVPEDSEMEVREMSNGTLRIIESIYGHVGGGGGSPKDDIFIDREVKEFLKL